MDRPSSGRRRRRRRFRHAAGRSAVVLKFLLLAVGLAIAAKLVHLLFFESAICVWGSTC